MHMLMLIYLLSLDLEKVPYFSHLGSDEGLSQSTVWDILQDKQGFLWIATSEGLNRYDGYEFLIYKHEPGSTTSLSDNQIRAMCLGRNEDIWLATGHGLNHFDLRTRIVTQYHYRPTDVSSLAYDYLVSLVRDENTLWIGSRNGLNRMDLDQPGVFRRYQHQPGQDRSLNHNEVRDLIIDRRGRLWIGTFNGLARYDAETDQFERWTHDPRDPNSLNHPNVRALAQDAQGLIWIGTSRGLHSLNPDTGQMNRYTARPQDPTALSDDWINTLLSDSETGLWIGTKDGGLHHFDARSQQFQRFVRDPNISHSISGNNIISLYVDRARILWVGTFGSGLSKLDLKAAKIRKIDFQSRGKEAKEIQALHMDREGNLWVGTQYGLLRHRSGPGRIDFFEHDPENPDSISENQVLSLASDKLDRVWAGTYSGGLNRYEGEGRFANYRHDSEKPGSLGNDVVLRLHTDRGGTLWVGTRAGLERYDLATDSFERLTYPDADQLGRRQMAVIEIFEAGDGTIWLGTDGAGAARYNPGTGDFQRFRHDLRDPSSINADVVNAIHEDNEGTLWFGTNSGLNRYNPQNQAFFNIGAQNGLPPATIYCILSGPMGELWLSTNIGIFRFEPSGDDLNTRHFDVSDGLQSNDFFRAAGLRADDGYIYFGGINGVNVFNPINIKYNEFPPPIVLTTVKIFDRNLTSPLDVSYLDQFELSHKQNMLSFEFSALDFSAPRKNRYAYKLDGFDSDWIFSGDRNFASYSNLAGGTYRFKVKAANNHGKWNEEGLEVLIRVTPPFWRTMWFLGLVTATVGGLAWFAQRRWILSMRRRNDQLQDLVEHKTFELEQAKMKLLETAHQAGIFEIATGVLRQIKDQLEDVKNVVKEIRHDMNGVSLTRMSAANEAVKSAIGNAEPGDRETEILENSRRELSEFANLFEMQRGSIERGAMRLVDRVEHMKDTISVQHQYAMTPLYHQEVQITGLIEDALRLESSRIGNMGVEIHKNFDVRPRVRVPKIKVLHVLTQIIKNSLDALEVRDVSIKRMRFAVEERIEGCYQITVEDNGCGIDPDHLDRVFNAGWTTKTERHGFGLHESVNAMREMGGELIIQSPGKNMGTKVIVTLPKD
ncbi:Histidine kinase domain-containing protein [Sulfidibacter corallicola]|uniref:Histidine kinase domain-containing protein n=1 Tax=Sulfidibacter corallicola TaxID=2818388 RepID=A0A8A4TK26_SULCO|nr:sensor histidine kinase [Sulfidibacter corallicola]QTD50369.1 hypothetical protein J3U87_32695 [Sulfidibacter corallicola]